jgi:hypothetical protein
MVGGFPNSIAIQLFDFYPSRGRCQPTSSFPCCKIRQLLVHIDPAGSKAGAAERITVFYGRRSRPVRAAGIVGVSGWRSRWRSCCRISRCRCSNGGWSSAGKKRSSSGQRIESKVAWQAHVIVELDTFCVVLTHHLKHEVGDSAAGARAEMD